MNRINQLLTKVCLLLTLVVFSFGVGYSATYYISNGGNDSNTGITTSQAWKSLAKVNSWTFKPGDQILFQRGSAFYGSLTVKNSGTSGNPITYGAYGTGNNPVITGFTAVTSWKNLGNNIWESTDAVSTLETCNMVTVDGVNTAMGRTPNDGSYYTFQSHSGSTSITSSNLTGTPNWTGAEAVMRIGHFKWDRRIITSQSTSTINWTIATSYEPENNFGFFIQNDSRTLDIQNEWHFNTTTKKIRVYSTSQPVNVKLSTVESLCNVSASYIKIQNISFTGANSYAVWGDVHGTIRSNVTIANCNFNFIGNTAIDGLKCNSYVIDNNSFSDCNTKAIDLGYSTGITITNNKIDNTALFEGMANGMWAAIHSISATDLTVEYNRITDSGFNGISYGTGTNNIIRYNYIDGFCIKLDDGAGIYGGVNSTVSNNIVINGIGAPQSTAGTFPTIAAGIYHDAGSATVTVSNNSVANCKEYGIFCNGNAAMSVLNNTVYNASKYQLRLTAWNDKDYTVNGNKFICKDASQMVMFVNSGANDIPSKYTGNNNYFASPIGTTNLIYIEQPSTIGNRRFTLFDWQSFSKQDVNSSKALATIKSEDDIEIKYNASKESLVINIDQPMVDVKGTKYYGKHTLQPYTSVVLLKVAQTPVVATEYKTICEGTNYNGWTTSGQYELKSVDAKGNFTMVTVYLTVVPVSKITENITINEGENYQGWNQTGTYTRKLTAVAGCDSLVTTNLVVVKLINKQGEVLPTHYSPSGLSQTGQNPMVLRIEGAQLEDLPLGTGDEIAVFSGSNCVGAIRLSQPIQSGDPASFATMSVYPRTATTTGFVPNDTIVFKLWSAQLQKEMSINEVNYKNNLESWMTTGKFTSGSASVVELFSYTELTQTINLKEGYNLISAYVLPTNADAGNVLKSLTLSGSLTKVQDESGRAYENWGTAGGWVNSIGLMEETEGYKVRVTADCTLKITGRPVALPLDIPLVEGWNLISYPRMDEANAMSVIQSLIDENKLVKVQDEDGSAIENWQLFGGWINGIGNFVPGKAYKIKVSAPTVLHINDNYLKAAVLLAQSAQTEHFFSIAEGNGTDHMNINLSGLSESGLQIGDEVGAFDGSVCVGSFKVTSGHLDNGLAVITASYKTDASVKDGFNEGNTVQLRIWKQQTGTEASANLICNAGRLVYERNASVFVQLKSVALTTSVNTLSNRSEVVVYPNPSDGAFTVKFDQMPEEGSRIDILDLSGRKITSRLVFGYAEDFNLAGQAPGVYLVKSTQGSKEVVRKLIIN